MSLGWPTYVSGHRHTSTYIDIHRQGHESIPTNTCIAIDIEVGVKVTYVTV